MHWRTKLLILILPAIGSASPKYDRLDPHGRTSENLGHIQTLKGHNECSVCHIEKHKKIETRAHIEDTCSSCHNKAPHSGVAEHLGKMKFGAAITCLSCHAPHRWEGTGSDWAGKFSDFRKDMVVPEGLKYSPKRNSMIKTTCTECHKW